MKILIIGDSMIKYFGDHIPNQINDIQIDIKAYPGATVDNIIQELSLIQKEYEIVVLHVGTNNAGKRNPPNLENLVASAFKISNHLLVTEVLHRQSNKFRRHENQETKLKRLNSNINLINLFFRKLDDENTNVNFLQVKDSNNLISTDGIHLNRKGNRVVSKLFLEKIIEISSHLKTKEKCNEVKLSNPQITLQDVPCYSDVPLYSVILKKGLTRPMSVLKKKENVGNIKMEDFPPLPSRVICSKDLLTGNSFISSVNNFQRKKKSVILPSENTNDLSVYEKSYQQTTAIKSKANEKSIHVNLECEETAILPVKSYQQKTATKSKAKKDKKNPNVNLKSKKTAILPVESFKQTTVEDKEKHIKLKSKKINISSLNGTHYPSSISCDYLKSGGGTLIEQYFRYISEFTFYVSVNFPTWIDILLSCRICFPRFF